jgi:hypothetical protein
MHVMGSLFTWIDGWTAPYEVPILAGMIAGFPSWTLRHRSSRRPSQSAHGAGQDRALCRAGFFAKAGSSAKMRARGICRMGRVMPHALQQSLRST